MKEMVMSQRQKSFLLVRTLGRKLTADLKGDEKLPLFVCVMKGAMPFMVDLIEIRGHSP
jgi:hypoxanthine-guanine phosphoribosyltransferase